MSDTVEPAILDFDGDDYNESQDEDFDPTKLETTVRGNDSSDSDDEKEDEEDRSYNDYKGYSKGEMYSGDTQDKSNILISTRSARKAQEELARSSKYERLDSEPISNKIKELWEDLKVLSGKQLHSKQSIMATEGTARDNDLREEEILIDRTYMFAGEMVRNKKWVLKSSAEGKEYLKSLKVKEKQQEASKVKSTRTPGATRAEGMNNLRRPLKRPPLLEQIISGAIKPKLTTLEKSKLDWATYVDKEGINDELQSHNKDGYLAKQDFLAKVQLTKDEQYKEMRRNELKKRTTTIE
ncbi:HER013Cp [Eremothecium sinecaudum]|uniref:SWR1-complex protein 5 n=1 Tax=Eremothecium sinecaudum TaxID=45286 RepID=A0A0X8HTM2_9SACH|nr:HER013Cp [Eremothecium sinecaudum]AMD21292.1 HER013Cp [Eremothecium sinecaudum]